MIKQISKNVFTGWTQIVLSILFTIIITPKAINTLGRESYGLWLLIFHVIGYLYLADFGVTNSISRIYAKYNILNDIKKLGSLIYSAYLIIILVDILIIIIALHFYDNIMVFLNVSENMKNVFIPLYIIAIIELIIQMLLRINIGILQGIHKFNLPYTLDSAAIIIKFTAISIFLYLDKLTIVNFAIIYTLSKIITNIWTFYYLKKELQFIVFKVDNLIFKEMTSLGISSLIISLFSVLYNSVPTLLYGKLFAISNVIIYAIPMSIMLLISKFINIIFISLVPKISELKTIERTTNIYKISALGRKFSLILNVIFTVFIIFFAKDLLKLWLTGEELNSNDFILMYHILILLMGYLSFSNIQKINNIIFKSAGLHWIATLEMILSVTILYVFSLLTFKLFRENVFALGMLIVGIFKFLYYKYISQNKITISSHSISSILLHAFAVAGLYQIVHFYEFSILNKITIFIILFAMYILFSFMYTFDDEEKNMILLQYRKKI